MNWNALLPMRQKCRIFFYGSYLTEPMRTSLDDYKKLAEKLNKAEKL